MLLLRLFLILFILTSFASLQSCVSTPSHAANACEVFSQKYFWFKAAKKSSKKWKVPIATLMSIINQESAYKQYAKPQRKKLFGFIPLLKRGLDIDGEHLCVEKVIFLKKDKNLYTRLEIHLNHGRKREIRRLFEAFNYQVKKLIRRQIGGLTLQGIKTGCYRLLNSADIKKLTSTRN